jgi:hypothetical protein
VDGAGGGRLTLTSGRQALRDPEGRKAPSGFTLRHLEESR